MKYTLKTIKQTLCYKANLAAVKAVYPNDWHRFARELMLAFNSEAFWRDVKELDIAIYFNKSPQGYDPWQDILEDINFLYYALPENHSCSYHCDRPACIKQQRDEFVKKFIWECAV